MSMSMRDVFNLLERIHLRNTGRSGLSDKIQYPEKVNFLLKNDDGEEVRGN